MKEVLALSVCVCVCVFDWRWSLTYLKPFLLTTSHHVMALVLVNEFVFGSELLGSHFLPF